ncbi:MAG: hypothetical protein QM722_18505 [Piscinibacter sp.]
MDLADGRHLVDADRAVAGRRGQSEVGRRAFLGGRDRAGRSGRRGRAHAQVFRRRGAAAGDVDAAQVGVARAGRDLEAAHALVDAVHAQARLERTVATAGQAGRRCGLAVAGVQVGDDPVDLVVLRSLLGVCRLHRCRGGVAVGDLHDAVLCGQDLIALADDVADLEQPQLAVGAADQGRAPQRNHLTFGRTGDDGHDGALFHMLHCSSNGG